MMQPQLSPHQLRAFAHADEPKPTVRGPHAARRQSLAGILDRQIERIPVTCDAHARAPRTGMAADVAEGLLDDAVDMDREIRRDVRDRSAGGEGRPNAGLPLELLDRTSESFLQPEVVEHTRMEPLRLRA